MASQVTVEQSSFKEDPLGRGVLSALLDAKHIIVICGTIHQWTPFRHSQTLTQCDVLYYIGAGISVAAGIPDFRSSCSAPGLPEMQKKKLKDMFHASVLSVSGRKNGPPKYDTLTEMLLP
jgi:hypothetical protein